MSESNVTGIKNSAVPRNPQADGFSVPMASSVVTAQVTGVATRTYAHTRHRALAIIAFKAPAAAPSPFSSCADLTVTCPRTPTSNQDGEEGER